MGPLLSIGITSYKRINELLRCINSIQTKHSDKIEILISEDCSPLSKEIEEAVEKLDKTKYNIIFTRNERNLGYDMNLGAIMKKCRGKYVFLMSDDDMMNDGYLDKIIPFLQKENNYGVIYSPFIYSDTKKTDRNRGKSFVIKPGEKSAATYIYDSILFSGLIFRREYVTDLDAARFKNHNYFQVYMFLKMLNQYGGFYYKNPSVVCVGDGENAYGLSESSGGNAILANRKEVKSNLEFNKTLIETIRKFDREAGTHVIDSFAKQYSLHSYSGMSIARQKGKKYFKEYYGILRALDIKLSFIVRAYYIILLVLGKEGADAFMNIFRHAVKNEKVYDK